MDSSCFQRGNQPVKGEVLNFNRAVEMCAQRVCEVHADSGWLSFFVCHFKRRISEFHSDDQGPGFRGGVGAYGGDCEKKGEEVEPHMDMGWTAEVGARPG